MFTFLAVSSFVNRAVLLVTFRFQRLNDLCHYYSAWLEARFALQLSNRTSFEDALSHRLSGSMFFVRCESRNDSHTLCQEVFL